MRDARFGQDMGGSRIGGDYPPPSIDVDHFPLSPRNKFLRDWTLVKRARFNAAKRCESKQSASMIAFGFTGVFGFAVPFFTLLFKDALTQHNRDILEFTSYVAGALSLVFGVIEQAKDYPAKARRFDVCGRRVNAALRALLIISPPDQQQKLQHLVGVYDRALEDCGDNHDDIDYELAKAEQALHDASPADRDRTRSRLARVKRYVRFTIYGPYILAFLMPVLIGVLLLIFLPAPAPPGAG